MSALNLFDVQREHGGTVYDGGRRWVGPGPGHSKRDASLSVWLADGDRAVLHSFAGDPFQTCARHLGLSQTEASAADRATIQRLRRDREAAERRRASHDADFCEAVWRGAQSLTGSPAESYLFGRGLILDHVGDLRFHPCAPRSKTGEQTSPAMVAVVRDRTGAAQALHATSVMPDGTGKAFGDRSRLMFGRTAGGAVHLRPMGDDGVLALAEGIETAASFDQMTNVPTWAALSAPGLSRFVPPAGVRKLIIAADSDDSGAGLQAAQELAQRASSRCSVVIHPAPAGSDWNDVLRAGGLADG